MSHLLVFGVPAGAGSGGSSSGPLVYVVIAVSVIGIALSFFRLRRGGPGPAVNYVPRRFRGRVNSAYRKAGWQQPYDSKGDRNRDRSDT